MTEIPFLIVNLPCVKALVELESAAVETGELEQ